jgi:transposase-like protein
VQHDTTFANLHELVENQNNEASLQFLTTQRIVQGGGRRRDWKKRLCFTSNHIFEPWHLLKFLQWYCTHPKAKTPIGNKGMSRRTFQLLKFTADIAVYHKVMGNQASRKLGNSDSFVCIDETFMTKSKRTRSRFVGKPTKGKQQLVLGMVEVNKSTRKRTGFILVPIKSRDTGTLKPLIAKHVNKGSIIVTDEWSAYSFLSEWNSGFIHRTVCHEHGDFGHDDHIFGKLFRVSTNACEGLFGQFKTYLRRARLRLRNDKFQEDLRRVLGEFMWTFSEERSVTTLCQAIAEQHSDVGSCRGC